MVYLNALKEQTHRTMEESAPTLDSLKKEYDFAYRFADFLPRSSASAATMQEYSLFLECSLKAHEAAVSSKPETKSEAASSKPATAPKKVVDMKKKKRRRKPVRITMPRRHKKRALVIPSPASSSDESTSCDESD